MKRSIVKQGAATLMVSLPSKWTKKYNLNKGDEVDVIEKGKELILSREISPEIKRISINLSEYESSWRMVIRALYSSGYDEIEIKINRPDEAAKVHSVLQEFVGFEIVSQTEKSCTIKEIVEAKETNFTAILNRTFNMLSSIAEDCSNALKSKNSELLKAITERDLIINKYANFCIRVINKGLVQPEDAPMLYSIIQSIETLGDMYNGLSKDLFESKKTPNANLIKILDDLNMMIKDFQGILNKFDKRMLVAFSERLKKIKKSIEASKTKSAEEMQTLNYLSQMREIFYGLMGPLLTLNSSLLGP